MLDLDLAASWHHMYALHIDLWIDGLEEMPASLKDVGDHTACDFGKWLHGSGRRYAHLPGYANLVECHKAFHVCAHEAVALQQAGKHEEARHLLATTFSRASSDVVSAIGVLKDEVSKERGFVRQPANAGHSEWQWDASLEIGVSAIDSQHKALLQLANRIFRQDSVGSESATRAMSTFGKLLELHFSTEEMFMRRCGMPERQISDHVTAHNKILETYVLINLDIASGMVTSITDIHDTIVEWVISHVVEFDLDLAQYAENTDK